MSRDGWPFVWTNTNELVPWQPPPEFLTALEKHLPTLNAAHIAHAARRHKLRETLALAWIARALK